MSFYEYTFGLCIPPRVNEKLDSPKTGFCHYSIHLEFRGAFQLAHFLQKQNLNTSVIRNGNNLHFDTFAKGKFCPFWRNFPKFSFLQKFCEIVQTFPFSRTLSNSLCFRENNIKTANYFILARAFPHIFTEIFAKTDIFVKTFLENKYFCDNLPNLMSSKHLSKIAKLVK